MRRAPAVAQLAAVPALALLAPATTGPTGPLLAAVSLAAWACTGWLLLVTALEHGTRVPGTVGRLAARLARRAAPASVRSLVRVALGVTLASSLLSGTAALAEDRTPTVAGSTSDWLDWPGLAPVTSSPAGQPGQAPLPTATGPAPRHPPAVAPTPSSPPAPTPSRAPASDVPALSGSAVVVRAGDSLWSLAARSLGPDASDAAVAQEWPRWWAANRSVVGDHPDLIHPGDRLSAPRPLGNPS